MVSDSAKRSERVTVFCSLVVSILNPDAMICLLVLQDPTK